MTAPGNHTPEMKRGGFGTDRLGHFYAELKDVTQRNPDGASRQRIIRDAVNQRDLLILELPTRGSPGAVKVCTLDHRQIGHLPGVEGSSLLNRIARQYRFAAVVDEVSEREVLEGHTRYNVNALILRVAPGVPDQEICEYVHLNFHSGDLQVEHAILKAFELAPSCEPAVPAPARDPAPEPVTAPEPVPIPPPTPPPGRDVPRLAAALEAAVLSLALSKTAFKALIDELGSCSVEQQNRVRAMVEELADSDSPVTEDAARELINRTER